MITGNRDRMCLWKDAFLLARNVSFRCFEQHKPNPPSPPLYWGGGRQFRRRYHKTSAHKTCSICTYRYHQRWERKCFVWSEWTGPLQLTSSETKQPRLQFDLCRAETDGLIMTYMEDLQLRIDLHMNDIMTTYPIGLYLLKYWPGEWGRWQLDRCALLGFLGNKSRQ